MDWETAAKKDMRQRKGTGDLHTGWATMNGP